MNRSIPIALTTALLVFGCNSTKPTKSQPAMNSLTAHTWKLIQMEGLPVPADAGITMQLSSDGKLTGDTGVNRYFGTYTTGKPNFIQFSAIGMTRRAGPEDRMNREAQFTAALERITEYQLDANTLSLTDGHKSLLVWTR